MKKQQSDNGSNFFNFFSICCRGEQVNTNQTNNTKFDNNTQYKKQQSSQKTSFQTSRVNNINQSSSQTKQNKSSVNDSAQFSHYGYNNINNLNTNINVKEDKSLRISIQQQQQQVQDENQNQTQNQHQHANNFNDIEQQPLQNGNQNKHPAPFTHSPTRQDSLVKKMQKSHSGELFTFQAAASQPQSTNNMFAVQTAQSDSQNQNDYSSSMINGSNHVSSSMFILKHVQHHLLAKVTIKHFHNRIAYNNISHHKCSENLEENESLSKKNNHHYLRSDEIKQMSSSKSSARLNQQSTSNTNNSNSNKFRLQLYNEYANDMQLFDKFTQGVRVDLHLDQENLTPEKIACYLAKRASKQNFIIDAFCGTGGNAIQFGKFSQFVLACEVKPLRCECTRNNALVYGLRDTIDIIQQDFFKLPVHSLSQSRHSHQKADMVFLNPDINLTKSEKQTLLVNHFSMLKHLSPNLNMSLQYALQLANNVLILLPKYIEIYELASLIDEKIEATFQLNTIKRNYQSIEIEYIIIDNKIDKIAIYVGEIKNITEDEELTILLLYLYNINNEQQLAQICTSEATLAVQKALIRQLISVVGLNSICLAIQILHSVANNFKLLSKFNRNLDNEMNSILFLIYILIHELKSFNLSLPMFSSSFTSDAPYFNGMITDYLASVENEHDNQTKLKQKSMKCDIKNSKQDQNNKSAIAIDSVKTKHFVNTQNQEPFQKLISESCQLTNLQIIQMAEKSSGQQCNEVNNIINKNNVNNHNLVSNSIRSGKMIPVTDSLRSIHQHNNNASNSKPQIHSTHMKNQSQEEEESEKYDSFSYNQSMHKYNNDLLEESFGNELEDCEESKQSNTFQNQCMQAYSLNNQIMEEEEGDNCNNVNVVQPSPYTKRYKTDKQIKHLY